MFLKGSRIPRRLCLVAPRDAWCPSANGIVGVSNRGREVLAPKGLPRSDGGRIAPAHSGRYASGRPPSYSPATRRGGSRQISPSCGSYCAKPKSLVGYGRMIRFPPSRSVWSFTTESGSAQASVAERHRAPACKREHAMTLIYPSFGRATKISAKTAFADKLRRIATEENRTLSDLIALLLARAVQKEW
jgi:hypothetical protein